jgi:hypothetical protein
MIFAEMFMNDESRKASEKGAVDYFRALSQHIQSVSRRTRSHV